MNDPSIPKAFTAFGGKRVQTGDAVWHLYRTHAAVAEMGIRVQRLRAPYEDPSQVPLVNFGLLDQLDLRPSAFTPRIRDLMTAYLVRAAGKYTGRSVHHMLLAFCWLEDWIHKSGEHEGETVDVEVLAWAIPAFAAHTVRTRRAGCRSLRHFFRWGYKKQLEGFSAERWIRIRTARFFSPPSGKRAKLGDPKYGALSFLEHRQVRQALRDPSTRTKPNDLALTWVLSDTGIRSVAVVRLEWGDLRCSELGDQYFLSVPRVKRKRPSGHGLEREISPDLGLLLEHLRGDALASDPIFPDLRDRVERPSVMVNRALKRFVRANNLPSIRQPKRNTRWGERPARLPLTSYRFRYTLATNLAFRGASPEQIAAFLDDDTLEMALVYVHNSSMMVDLLEETLDEYPLWRKTILKDFQGKLISSDEDGGIKVFAGATHLKGFAPLRRRELEIGRCVKNSPCVLRPPLTCYRCSYFNASPDPQPHLAQVKQIKEDLRSGVGTRSDRMMEVLLPVLLAIRDLLAGLGVESLDLKVRRSILTEE